MQPKPLYPSVAIRFDIFFVMAYNVVLDVMHPQLVPMTTEDLDGDI
jgi:hypothetical protein